MPLRQSFALETDHLHFILACMRRGYMLPFFAVLPLLSTPSEFPGQCESLTVSETSTIRRVRRPVPKEHVLHTIHAVAAEMGADPGLLVAIAQHESSLQPAALHVLPGDQRAGLLAWHASTYSETRAKRYDSILAQGANHPRFYLAKLGKWRMTRYQGNKHWHATTQVGEHNLNVWTYGYGLYGMAPVLYVGLWDNHSPPWVLCDARIATITLVWALRAQAAHCEKQGYAPTTENVLARFGSGKCGRKLGQGWYKLPSLRSKKMDAPVRLGKRWPNESDRYQVLSAVNQRLGSF